MSDVTLILGDCLEIMPTLEANSVDSIVTDPPYGLAFMGKDWDHGVPGVAFWQAALRIAKPGAHLLAFGGTRTFHRLAVAIEDAGWEIRDTVMWLYGSGFPKSHDVSKAIDKAAGAEREVVGHDPNIWARNSNGKGGYATGSHGIVDGKTTDGRDARKVAERQTPAHMSAITASATPEAAQWAGWGTALKPAWEPIIVARKPLEGTVAANVLAWGTGAINVDGCRVGTERPPTNPDPLKFKRWKEQDGNGRAPSDHPDLNTSQGRWPANVVHDGSDEVLAGFPQSDGGAFPGHRNTSGYGGKLDQGATPHGFYKMGDTGSAARFFYCAKASKRDRDEGCEGLEERNSGAYVMRNATDTGRDPTARGNAQMGGETFGRNHHPTVKPTDLMRWLVRLVTPPGGVVVDPFMGSGSTGKAAVLEGMRFIGIDREAEYLEIARRRIETAQLPLLEMAV